jgi:hypothetical protein
MKISFSEAVPFPELLGLGKLGITSQVIRGSPRLNPQNFETAAMRNEK